MKKADIIVDLQFGSTGKGAIAGYLAVNGDYDTVITANRPNAGHTFIDHAGNKMVTKILPNGIVGPTVKHALIGPGAIFSADQLLKELKMFDDFGYGDINIFIHESAVLLKKFHKDAETHYSRIGSTQQGAGAAQIEKMERNGENSPLAKGHDFGDERIKVVAPQAYYQLISRAKSILIEGAQGFSLGIDAGFWPYCTSRNCTVNQFLSDTAVPHTYLRKVIGVARTHPIRVAGTSGPGYADQRETSWEELGVESEFTTVTKKMRRVFTFSHDQIIEAIQANQPDEIFLNFCNYIGRNKADQLTREINAHCINHTGYGYVRYRGWGAAVGGISDIDVLDCEETDCYVDA